MTITTEGMSRCPKCKIAPDIKFESLSVIIKCREHSDVMIVEGRTWGIARELWERKVRRVVYEMETFKQYLGIFGNRLSH